MSDWTWFLLTVTALAIFTSFRIYMIPGGRRGLRAYEREMKRIEAEGKAAYDEDSKGEN